MIDEAQKSYFTELKEISSSSRFEDRLEYDFSSLYIIRTFFEVVYYLISHADFLDLFTKYGVKGNDISRLKEYGLISGGDRYEIIVEKSELFGFQNDNLVLTFSTDFDERITFE